MAISPKAVPLRSKWAGSDTQPGQESVITTLAGFPEHVHFTSMEPFLKKFFPGVYRNMKEDTKISNYCKFDSQLLTSFTSSLYIARLVASLSASPITRAFGRRPSILFGGPHFLPVQPWEVLPLMGTC